MTETYAAVYEQEHVALLRFAALLCRDRAQSEDAVAAAFADVLPAWRAARVENVSAYLRTAVVNRLRSDERRRMTVHRHGKRWLVARDHAFEARADLHLAVLTALRGLPPRQRAAVVLRFYEDRPLVEVAEILGCPIGTAKSLVSRALATLRPSLEEVRHAD